MVFKNLCVLVLWMKVTLALERLKEIEVISFSNMLQIAHIPSNFEVAILCFYNSISTFQRNAISMCAYYKAFFYSSDLSAPKIFFNIFRIFMNFAEDCPMGYYF